MIYLKIRHIFKSCNICLKPERFCKSKFPLSKVKLEEIRMKISKQYIQAFVL